MKGCRDAFTSGSQADPWVRGTDVSDRTCSVEGCEKPRIARGWCHKHYKRWQTHGDPLTILVGPESPRTAAVRFWEKVNKCGPIPEHRPELGRCWLWDGTYTRDGYGQFIDAGKHFPAHRWAYLDIKGAISAGLELDHLCRVRGCIRPGHLEAVTHRENVRRGESPSAAQMRQTHCIRGHEFTEANTFFQPKGTGFSRRCRACGAAAKRARGRSAS